MCCKIIHLLQILCVEPFGFPLFVCRHNDDGFLIQSLIVFLFLDSYSFHATTIIFSIIPVNWCMNLSNLFGVIWCGVLYVRQFV